MHTKLLGAMLALALSILPPPAAAQAPLVRMGALIGTGAMLVAGDLTFSNFTLPPLPIPASPPLDGVGDIAASAAVDADGNVALAFTAIDPATGVAVPIVGATLKAIAYDVTMTNPARLLSTVNQSFGPLTTAAFHLLTYRPPAPTPPRFASGIAGQITTDDTLFFDDTSDVFVAGGLQNTKRMGALLSAGCPYFFASGPADPPGCASPLPGGLRAAVGLHSFFGVVLDRHSFIATPGFPANVFDGVVTTFTLVPADTPPVAIPVSLGAIDVSQPGIARVSLGHTIDADGLAHPGFAPAGGLVVALTTSNAAALPLPATVTMPQGSSTTIFVVGDAHIDAPANVSATATYNGVTVQQTATVNPPVPLSLLPMGASFAQGGSLLNVALNRVNFSPAVIALSSSVPAVAPVPGSVTIAPLTQNSGWITVPIARVAADTPITFTATFNGGSVTRSYTVPKTVDSVSVTKAELTVKTGQLKVEAGSNVPTAVLTLSNATTGQAIGTMTNLGQGKYSFQGTVSPVTSLRLNSSFNGTALGAVAQK